MDHRVVFGLPAWTWRRRLGPGRFLPGNKTNSAKPDAMKTSFGLLLACLLALLNFSASAATKTWDGSSSGNWNANANWSGSLVPNAGDDLVFPAGATRLDITNNFSPNRAFNSITILGSNYVIRGSALIITNGLRMGTPGAPTQTDPTTNLISCDLDIRAAQ